MRLTLIYLLISSLFPYFIIFFFGLGARENAEDFFRI